MLLTIFIIIEKRIKVSIEYEYKIGVKFLNVSIYYILVTLSTSWHFFKLSPHFPSRWYANAHSVWNHMHCISFKFSMGETPSY